VHESPIYLDYNATTPVDERVLEAMLPYFHDRFGNPSSTHRYGLDAHAALDTARKHVARLIDASPDEVVFTGGGSVTDNLAIKGVVFAALDRAPHVITTSIEHPAVLNTLRYLQQRFGVNHSIVPVDTSGRVDPAAIEGAINDKTVLVTVMHANNEVGTLQPIEAIGRICRGHGVLFHVDAAQSAGKVTIDVDTMQVDLLTIAGHKLYAPKGIGALYVRRDTHLDSLIHGSSQEQGLHAGTENIASIVALGAACALAQDDLASEPARLTTLRDLLHGRLSERIPGLELNGHPTQRLPNTLNVSVPGGLGQAVLDSAPGVAASTGSACHSGVTEPSAVLLAMGQSSQRALGAVRLSLGRWTTEREIESAAAHLGAAYAHLAGVRSLMR
jgi:cysteine desulfurase